MHPGARDYKTLQWEALHNDVRGKWVLQELVFKGHSSKLRFVPGRAEHIDSDCKGQTGLSMMLWR